MLGSLSFDTWPSSKLSSQQPPSSVLKNTPVFPQRCFFPPVQAELLGPKQLLLTDNAVYSSLIFFPPFFGGITICLLDFPFFF